MTRDYAGRAKTRTTRQNKRHAPAAQTRATRAQRERSSVQFNAPSFSAGLVLGGALVLLLPYLSSILDAAPVAQAGVGATETPEIIFDFDAILSRSEVTTDTSAYPVEFESTDPDAVTSTYLLQAASFHSFAEAAELQAKLSRQDLPATVSRVSVQGSAWFRVTVGPFNRQKEAQRAMTRLRENNLSPLPLKRG